MAMEIYVFSDRQLQSVDVWQRAIDDCGFALRLSTGVPFDLMKGLLPVTLGKEETGFECDHWNAQKAMAEMADVDFGHSWKYMLALRMVGSRISEVISAYMAASAYARATNGVVFDCEEGKIISAQRAAEIAQELELAAPRLQEMVAKAQQSALKK